MTKKPFLFAAETVELLETTVAVFNISPGCLNAHVHVQIIFPFLSCAVIERTSAFIVGGKLIVSQPLPPGSSTGDVAIPFCNSFAAVYGSFGFGSASNFHSNLHSFKLV